MCTEYNDNHKKYREVTTAPLSFNYTDLAVLDYVPDFIVYDRLIKGQHNDSFIRPKSITMLVWKTKQRENKS